MTKDELAAKVEWEGGIPDAILDYGLTIADLPVDVIDAWYRIYMISDDVDLVNEWLMS
jgi:hypothetical protein